MIAGLGVESWARRFFCCPVYARPKTTARYRSAAGIAGYFRFSSLIGRLGSSTFRLRHCNVDVAHGLALLFGIGTKAVPSWDPRTRWSNLSGGLAVRGTAGPSRHANSPHPSSREGHHSTARWSSSVLIGLDAARFSCCCCGLFSGPAELGAVNPYAVHDHSQPAWPGPRSPFSSRGAWRSASPRP